MAKDTSKATGSAESKQTDEEEAKALAAKAFAQANQAPPPAPAAPVRKVGDVPVTCLKTENNCVLGGRRYVLKTGAEIMMDPSHAEELEQGGWVARVVVIGAD